MLTIGLGILSSIVAEVIVKLNKALQGTVLQGTASFLFAACVAFVVAGVKVFYVDGTPLVLGNYQVMAPIFLQVLGASNAFFWVVVKSLNLDVKPDYQ